MAFATGRYAWAICDRCRLQYPYQSLMADGNSPALRVCRECRDDLDPYRLPAPPPDPIALRFPRPDVDLGEPVPPYILTELDFVIATTEGNELLY